MLKKATMLIGGCILSMHTFANTYVEMKTTMGDIEIELFDKQAPISTRNFENYIKSNFYAGTTFHRVIPGFMIQGGGLDVNLKEKTTRPPIKNEASNGLKNTRGTIAMARTNNPNSATSQFFINVADNDSLNASAMNSGYAVFGKVTKGMNIVDKIVQAPTTSRNGYQNVPQNPIKIIKVIIKPQKSAQ